MGPADEGELDVVQVARGLDLLSRFEMLSDGESAELLEVITHAGSITGLLDAALSGGFLGMLEPEQARFARCYRLLLRLMSFEPELSSFSSRDLSSSFDEVGEHLSAGRLSVAEDVLSQVWSGLVRDVEGMPEGPGGLLALGLIDLVSDL